MINKVKEWHEKFNVPVAANPCIPAMIRCQMRQDILQEEVLELYHAWVNMDIVKVADGIADCLYVLYGTALEFGLGDKMEEIFAEVHRSNMSKLGLDGKPVMRFDGKIMKGPNFTKPDLNKIIYEKTI